ncbi:GNAT family N-acetyltransferase [Hymenobacter negativus]|uniref:GNAT family N-acetyltransferase n=1 Tax=Hymenobacter negativus TaxID=2795026 RepID=A0ABS3QED8_9BACT|nr:GNAT family N-acetyltransferase [Hymenobacter negativus]MBO2009532.1 GNAT family N-acetyltransferase [Hymenobacter negativus]
MNTIEHLPWDSDFLGYGVARLSLDSLNTPELAQKVAQAKTDGLRLLYLVASPADTTSNRAAQQVNALLVDRKVTFTMPVNAVETAQTISSHIRLTDDATPQLESLALQSGEYSRFRLDSNFAAGTFERLYHQWLYNSLSRTLAREVLVYEPAPVTPAMGLLTLGLKQGRADIGLLAVDSSSRGRGVGHLLIQAAKRFTAEWGLTELQVATQLDNQSACNFYRKCGFVEHQIEYIYHLWLSV